jgi:hypothetical protein
MTQTTAGTKSIQSEKADPEVAETMLKQLNRAMAYLNAVIEYLEE